MFGDIDADGMLEVVFATTSGAVYAVNGRSGRDIAKFPFRTRGRVLAPVLLTKAMPAMTALQAVVPSTDGHLYIIDGKRGTLMAYFAHAVGGGFVEDPCSFDQECLHHLRTTRTMHCIDASGRIQLCE